jgi:hypothetical protein
VRILTDVCWYHSNQDAKAYAKVAGNFAADRNGHAPGGGQRYVGGDGVASSACRLPPAWQFCSASSTRELSLLPERSRHRDLAKVICFALEFF